MVSSNGKIYNLEEFNYNDKFQFYNIQSKNNNKQELNNFLGFGWERDNSNQIIMNGYKSSLLFDFNKKNCENKKKLILKFKKYFAQVRDPVVLKVSFNEIYYENITIINNLDYKVDISSICKKDNKLKIDLIAIDPKSLFDLRNGLNRKKRSIILNEIELTTK